jgi:hypothetical protein
VTSPERLRRELERLRDRGISFTEAWPVAISVAVRGERHSSAIWWRTTFAEQRHVWTGSYSRAPWPANRRPVLAPFDYDDGDPRVPVRARIVA